MIRILLWLLLLPVFTEAQFITTIAGNGIAGYTGDGGSATATELNFASAVAVDNMGNVYIADYRNSRLRKVNTAGIITTIAGNGAFGSDGDGGTATAAMIEIPTSIAVDRWGNVYFTDPENSMIRKIDATGIVNEIAGAGISGLGDGGLATAAELNHPEGVAVDGFGNIYIADYSNNRVRKINKSGIISTIAGGGISGLGDGGMATAAELNSPLEVTVDSVGNVYVSDAGNNRIRKIDTTGIITTIAGGGASSLADGVPATSVVLDTISKVAVDGVGNVYCTAANNVLKVNTAGLISIFAGVGIKGYSGDGGPATAAELSGPGGLAVDNFGNLYITDVGNSIIRRVCAKCNGLSIPNAIIGERVVFYPNPTTTSVTITDSDKITSITITNLIGQTVYSNSYHNEKVQVDVSGLPAGMYLVRINGTEVRKFVKE